MKFLHLFMIIVALVALFLLNGCVHQIQFHNLRAITSSNEVPSYRWASTHGLIDGEPMTGSYVVSASDLLEFSQVDDVGKGKNITLEVGDCESCDCKNGSLSIGTELANTGSRPRISAFILNAAKVITVKAKQKSDPVVICTMPVLGTTWTELQERLEAKSGVKVSLLSKPRRRVMPGDSIRITIEYNTQVDLKRGPQPFTLVETISQVDSAGRVFIPTLSLAAPPELTPEPVHRLIQQEGARAALHIQLWRPDQAFDQQIALDDVERCLAGQWPEIKDEKDLKDELVAKCRQLGITDTTYAHRDKDNKYVRYKLDVQQKWTLALWDGRRIDALFVPGRSIADAAHEIFREAFGRRLIPGDIVFATIDPRRELRGQGDTPFYARLDETSTVLKSILLAPGDVVHLSYREPIRLRDFQED